MAKTAKTLSPTAVELVSARESLAFYKERVKYLASLVKEEKLDVKIAKIAARTARREAAIAKAKAKLEKLMAPVGAKAIKANRKPSKAKTTKFMTVVDQFGTSSSVAVEA